LGAPLPGIEIHPETASEIDDIRTINIDAFRDHPISRQTEHLIVEALRDTAALEVSLVAVTEGRTVGHIAFSRAAVGDSESGWFLLGPVAVLHDWRGRGVGSALVESGLSELRVRHANGCVLVGDPGYYSRFGFRTFPDLAYEGVPHEYVLGLPFTDAPPRGLIAANRAFEIEPESDAGVPGRGGDTERDTDDHMVVRLVEWDSPDFAALVSTLDAELEERYPGLGTGGPPPAQDLLVVVIAYSGDAPIGCGALRELEPGVAEIKRMFVVPEARRLGAARRMLEALETQGRALGYSAVRLGSGARQPEALALYESCGYCRIPLFGEYEGGTLCVCYEKALD
jgi:putative acetyltransferase